MEWEVGDPRPRNLLEEPTVPGTAGREVAADALGGSGEMGNPNGERGRVEEKGAGECAETYCY